MSQPPVDVRIVEVRRICRDDEANEMLKAGWLLLDVGSRQWTEAYGGKWIALKDVVYVLGWPEEEAGGLRLSAEELAAVSDELAAIAELARFEPEDLFNHRKRKPEAAKR